MLTYAGAGRGGGGVGNGRHWVGRTLAQRGLVGGLVRALPKPSIQQGGSVSALRKGAECAACILYIEV